MFDPVLLRSFIAVVDCGNFTRAAERLHLTQSTVSQQIRRLEEAVACQLLDRDQRRVVATAEGERLLAYARRILALHEEAADVLINQQSDGVLRLGVPEDFASERLMPLLSAFVRAYPRVRLEVTAAWARSCSASTVAVSSMYCWSSRWARAMTAWPRGRSRCAGSTAAAHPAWGATRCRWWRFRWAGCTAMKCCNTWKWAVGAGASGTPAQAWPVCVRQ